MTFLASDGFHHILEGCDDAVALAVLETATHFEVFPYPLVRLGEFFAVSVGLFLRNLSLSSPNLEVRLQY